MAMSDYKKITIDSTDHGFEDTAARADLADKTDIVIDTVSGSVASFPDGAAGIPVSDLKVGIVPVQDLHGYDNPWPAGGGKNLLPYDLEYVSGTSGYSFNKAIHLAPGTYALSFSSTSATSWRYCIVPYTSEGVISTTGTDITATTMTWRSDSTCYLSGANSTSKNAVFTVNNDGYFAFYIRFGDGASTATFSNSQLETGSSATSYAPYANICPISGWQGCNVSRTGKNLVNTSDITDYSKWSSTIAPNGNMPSTSSNLIYSLPISLKPGLQYTIYIDYKDTDIPPYLYFGYYIGDTTTRLTYITTNVTTTHSYTFIALENATYCLRMGSTDTEQRFDGAVAKILGIQLELSSTASSYSAYVGTTIPISWQTEAGTVYGGELDTTTGVLTVDRVSVTFDGSNDEGWAKFGTQTEAWIRQSWRTTSLPYNKKATSTSIGEMIGNGAIVLSTTSETHSGGITCRSTSYTSNVFYIFTPLTLAYELSDLQAMLSNNPLQIVYPLATPIEVQLTPTELTTLLGENRIFADTGDVAVTYPSDTRLYIEKKITELQALALEN